MPALAGTILYLLRDQIPSMPATTRVGDEAVVGVMANRRSLSECIDFARTAVFGAAASSFAQSMYGEIRNVWGKGGANRIG